MRPPTLSPAPPFGTWFTISHIQTSELLTVSNNYNNRIKRKLIQLHFWYAAAAKLFYGFKTDFK